MDYVLDTSVAMAWYLPEIFAEAAIRWQSKLNSKQIRIHVPTLHFWEVANALRSQVRRRMMTAAVANIIWANHLEAPIRVIDPAAQHVLATAFEYEATAYDAVYIALAIELDAQLLTAERKTTAWVTKLGDRAISIAALPS